MTHSPRALIIVDMQKGMHSPTLPHRNNPQAEANMLQLLTRWRTASWPVVHVRHISRSPDSVFRLGQAGAEFQEAFMPLDTEHVVEKNVPDAFVQSGLQRWLHVRAISDVVIVGVSTNNSVESTARSAGNLGFHTYAVPDACFTFDRMDLNGILRTADDIHLMSLTNLSSEYAQVVSTAQLLD